MADYLLVVPVFVNGRGPYDFVVDTGTSTTLIDPELASENAVQPVDRLILKTPAGETAVPRCFLDTVSMGSEFQNHVETLVQPLAELRSLDHRVRGVLGMNFFRQFSFLIDYKHTFVELFASSDTLDVKDQTEVPVEFSQGEMLIRVASKSAPQGSWQLTLDSGIAQPLIFRNHILPAASRKMEAGMMRVSTNTSQRSADVVVVNEIDFAGSRLHYVPFVVLRKDLTSQDAPGDGLLPTSLFHAILFDRENSSVILNPN